MTNNSLRCCFRCLLKALQFSVLIVFFGALTAAQAATNPPVLISDSVSTRAVAFESVTQRPEPFALTSSVSFAADNRTRVEIFAMNLDVLAGEGVSAFSADAQDTAGNHYPLNVEYVGQVPPAFDGLNTTDFRGIYMIVVRLNDAMGDLGDVLVRLNLHGLSTNRVRVAIGHVGGGPADDAGAVPTPAPATPPAPVTPLTIAQYQAQFSNPSFPSDQDRIRFLEQTTWGPNDAELTNVRNMGIQAYLNQQFSAADSGYPSLNQYPASSTIGCPSGTAPPNCVRDNYTMYPLQTQMVKNAVTGPDQLRQRVAFALHQFVVVGGNGVNNEASWMQPYLSTLDADAFGNFRTILNDVTLNAGMGDYLDMLNNSRAAPNENYAREIMQLFSIGVDTLNQDGTPVLDAQGNRKPSYDQNDITSLARVFTGWTLAPTITWVVDGTTQVPNYADPMRLNPANSNTYDLGLASPGLGPKTLLTDINHPTPLVLPACSNCTGGTAAQNLANAQ